MTSRSSEYEFGIKEYKKKKAKKEYAFLKKEAYKKINKMINKNFSRYDKKDELYNIKEYYLHKKSISKNGTSKVLGVVISMEVAIMAAMPSLYGALGLDIMLITMMLVSFLIIILFVWFMSMEETRANYYSFYYDIVCGYIEERERALNIRFPK